MGGLRALKWGPPHISLMYPLQPKGPHTSSPLRRQLRVSVHVTTLGDQGGVGPRASRFFLRTWGGIEGYCYRGKVQLKYWVRRAKSLNSRPRTPKP